MFRFRFAVLAALVVVAEPREWGPVERFRVWSSGGTVLVPITIIGDLDTEGDESFTVTLYADR